MPCVASRLWSSLPPCVLCFWPMNLSNMQCDMIVWNHNDKYVESTLFVLSVVAYCFTTIVHMLWRASCSDYLLSPTHSLESECVKLYQTHSTSVYFIDSIAKKYTAGSCNCHLVFGRSTWPQRNG